MKLLKLIPDNTNIKFLRWRLPFYAVSLLLMAASLGLVFGKGLNFGVDFIGGQMVRMTFVESSEAPVAELREQIGDLGYGEPIIQQFGQPNEISIRMKLPCAGPPRSAAIASSCIRNRTPGPSTRAAAARASMSTRGWPSSRTSSAWASTRGTISTSKISPSSASCRTSTKPRSATR